MPLTSEQLSSVSNWFAAGASLDEIQKRLASEFGVHVTYLDLRLLVADLPQPQENDAGVQDDGRAASPQAADGEAASPQAAESDDGPCVEDSSPCPDAGDDAAAPAPLSVTVDPITPPGFMAGGGVTFSDGTSGKWYLDGYGRLGFSGLPQGYRPSPEDAAIFQSRLVETLQSKGLM